MELIFAAIGMAVLLSTDKNFSRPLKNSPVIGLKQSLREGMNVFWQIFILILGCRWFLCFDFLNDYRREIQLAFYFAGAYGISRLQKRHGFFYLAVFVGCLLIDDYESAAVFQPLLIRSAVFAAGLTVFQAGMIGIRWRLLLNPPEAAFRQSALVFFAAAILAMGFNLFLK